MGAVHDGDLAADAGGSHGGSGMREGVGGVVERTIEIGGGGGAHAGGDTIVGEAARGKGLGGGHRRAVRGRGGKSPERGRVDGVGEEVGLDRIDGGWILGVDGELLEIHVEVEGEGGGWGVGREGVSVRSL